MSAAVADLPRTAARSEQLIAASERATHDPFTEVDWDQPIDDSAFHRYWGCSWISTVEGPEDDVEGSGLLEGERVKREIREKGLREGERR